MIGLLLLALCWLAFGVVCALWWRRARCAAFMYRLTWREITYVLSRAILISNLSVNSAQIRALLMRRQLLNTKGRIMEITLTTEQEDALIVAGGGWLIMPHRKTNPQAVENLVSLSLLQEDPERPGKKAYVITDKAREIMQQTKRKVLSITIPGQSPLFLDAPYYWQGDFRAVLADILEGAQHMDSGTEVFTVHVLDVSLWVLAKLPEWNPR